MASPAHLTLAKPQARGQNSVSAPASLCTVSVSIRALELGLPTAVWHARAHTHTCTRSAQASMEQPITGTKSMRRHIQSERESREVSVKTEVKMREGKCSGGPGRETSLQLYRRSHSHVLVYKKQCVLYRAAQWKAEACWCHADVCDLQQWHILVRGKLNKENCKRWHFTPLWWRSESLKLKYYTILPEFSLKLSTINEVFEKIKDWYDLKGIT